MTVREVMEATDRRRPNLYSREEKLRWLEEAEAMVWGALEAFHAVSGPYPGLHQEDWPGKKLMLPQAFTGLYFLWLEFHLLRRPGIFPIQQCHEPVQRLVERVFRLVLPDHSPAGKGPAVSVEERGSGRWKCPC